MSLGGIAIAIGATVDAEIVMVEAAHKKLEHAAPRHHARGAQHRLLAEAAREVTPAIFFSLLIIAVSFIPVFGLTGRRAALSPARVHQDLRDALGGAAVHHRGARAARLPHPGKIYAEREHPVSRDSQGVRALRARRAAQPRRPPCCSG
jgi:Cu(I)/Ag(I) efflux system membrane protein CusA/SilA